jgi:hypothetical protein
MHEIDLDQGPHEQDPIEILRRTAELYDEVGMIYESEEIAEMAAASFRGDAPRYTAGGIEIEKNGFRFIFFPKNQEDDSYSFLKHTITEGKNGARKISGGMEFHISPFRTTVKFTGIKGILDEVIGLTASEDAVNSFLREPQKISL